MNPTKPNDNAARDAGQRLANECGERVYVSEIGDSGKYRITKQSELSPITAHCADEAIEPKLPAQADAQTPAHGDAFVATTGRHDGGEWNSVVLASYHAESLSRLDKWWQDREAKTAARLALATASLRQVERERDALLAACKPFAFAPWDYNHPDQLIVKVGEWEVYGKDLISLRQALALLGGGEAP